MDSMVAPESQLWIAEGIAVPLAELRFAYVRSSGPGGQNVNKVNSQAQLTWDLTSSESLPAEAMERLQQSQRGRITKAGTLRIDSQRFRDREKNRLDCLERLRAMIVEVLQPPKKRRKTKVPKRVHEKRLRNKQERAQVKRSRQRPRVED